MNADPELPLRFANVVLEELACIRSEVESQRSALIELLSLTSKERRRTIKDRLYDKRLRGPMSRGPELKKRVGLRHVGKTSFMEVWQRQATWRSLVSDPPKSERGILCGYRSPDYQWLMFASHYSPDVHRVWCNGIAWGVEQIAQHDVQWTELPNAPYD